MSDYRKEQTLLIYDLIEQSNPGFLAKHPAGSLTIGVPSPVAVDPADPFKRDTQLTLSAKSSTGLRGSVTVKYRRIDLSVLFKNMTLAFDDYIPAGNLPAATWKAEFSKRFAISVLPDDFDPSNGDLVSGSSYPNVALSGSCLCYKGTIGLHWIRGKRKLDEAVTSPLLPLRQWPDGNSFAKPKGGFQIYGLNFTSLKDLGLETFASPASVVPGDNAPVIQALINFLNANTGFTDWNNGDTSVTRSVTGVTWARLSLPNPMVPEANSTDYNRALVLTSGSTSWFTGRLIHHYNI